MSLICASKSCQSGTLILSLFLSPGPGDDIMIYAAPSTNIHTLIAINIQFWFPIQDVPITSSIHRDLLISTLSIPNLPLVRAMPTDRDSGRVNGSFHSVDAFGISSCEKGWMISLAGAGPVDMNTLLYTRHDDKTRFYSQVSSEAFQMMFTDDGHRTYGSNYNTPKKESALMYSSLFKEVKVSEEAFHKTLNDLDLPMVPPILHFIPNRKYVLDRNWAGGDGVKCLTEANLYESVRLDDAI